MDPTGGARVIRSCADGKRRVLEAGPSEDAESVSRMPWGYQCWPARRAPPFGAVVDDVRAAFPAVMPGGALKARARLWCHELHAGLQRDAPRPKPRRETRSGLSGQEGIKKKAAPKGGASESTRSKGRG